jgi:hypothetical protein
VIQCNVCLDLEYFPWLGFHLCFVVCNFCGLAEKVIFFGFESSFWTLVITLSCLIWVHGALSLRKPQWYKFVSALLIFFHVFCVFCTIVFVLSSVLWCPLRSSYTKRCSLFVRGHMCYLCCFLFFLLCTICCQFLRIVNNANEINTFNRLPTPSFITTSKLTRICYVLSQMSAIVPWTPSMHISSFSQYKGI